MQKLLLLVVFSAICIGSNGGVEDEELDKIIAKIDSDNRSEIYLGLMKLSGRILIGDGQQTVEEILKTDLLTKLAKLYDCSISFHAKREIGYIWLGIMKYGDKYTAAVYETGFVKIVMSKFNSNSTKEREFSLRLSSWLADVSPKARDGFIEQGLIPELMNYVMKESNKSNYWLVSHIVRSLTKHKEEPLNRELQLSLIPLIKRLFETGDLEITRVCLTAIEDLTAQADEEVIKAMHDSQLNYQEVKNIAVNRHIAMIKTISKEQRNLDSIFNSITNFFAMNCEFVDPLIQGILPHLQSTLGHEIKRGDEASAVEIINRIIECGNREHIELLLKQGLVKTRSQTRLGEMKPR